MTVRLKAPHGNLNPHGFDYELWLWEQGVQATGYVRAGARDAAPARGWRRPGAIRSSARARRCATRSSSASPTGELAGVLAALVTGDQSAIERADWDVFRATGVAHLMSISGLHITMFAWLAGAGSRRGCGGAARASCCAGRRSTRHWPAAWCWPRPTRCSAAGACPRSARSGCWPRSALLRLAGRRWPWPCVWLLACAVVVALDPWALMQAGFWLSFVAVGVLFATDSGSACRTAGTGCDGRAWRSMLREQMGGHAGARRR